MVLDEVFRQQINPIKIFGLDGTRPYAQSVSDHLGVGLTPHVEALFPDEEPYIKSSSGLEGNVRGHDCFVIHSLYSDDKESVGDKLTNMALMCGALQGSKAHKVIGVIPYAAFNRQGRKVASRDGVATLIVHSMLVAAGMDHGLFIDPHDLPATQNSFPLRNFPDTLDCKKLFATWLVKELRKAMSIGPEEYIGPEPLGKRLVVLSPDAGAYVRCVQFAECLADLMGCQSEHIEVAVMPKIRKKGKIDNSRKLPITGDVSGALVVSYDDMFATFGTSKRAYDQVLAEGGTMFAIMASHGIFAGEANEQMRNVSPDVRIAVSDTIPPWRLEPDNRQRVQIVDTTVLVADAIRRIHSKTGSISQLLS